MDAGQRRDTNPDEVIDPGYFRDSNTEILRSCANLSKKGTVFKSVWALIRKLPSVSRRRGLAAGHFRQAAYSRRSPRICASRRRTIFSEFQISLEELLLRLPMASSGYV